MAADAFIHAVAATVAALLFVVLLGQAYRRASASVRHSVWRVALLAFWLVPVAAVSADVLHVRIATLRVPEVRAHSSIFQGRRFGVSRVRPSPALASGHALSLPANTETSEGLGLTPPSPFAVAVGLWSAGAMIGLAVLLRKLLALRRLLATASGGGRSAWAEQVAHWACQLGLRTAPRLAESAQVAVPTVAGWRSPILLLPPGLSEEDPGSDAIIAHELAHIARGDLAIQAVSRLTRVLWWWNPVAWLTARELSATAEDACDDWAVRLTGEGPAYAGHLVRWAEAATRGTGGACTLSGSDLSRRVRRLLAQRGPGDTRISRRAQLGIAVCALTAVVGASLVRAQTGEPGASGPGGERSTMRQTPQALEYGFRRDPMEFVETDDSLQGALVRTFVFERPKEGDAAIIRARIDEILGEQQEDGAFGPTSKETGERMLRLLQLGFPADSPQIARGVEALLRQKRAGQNANEWVEKEGALSIYALHALCLLGRNDIPEVQFSLKWYVDNETEFNDPWQGCPWTPEVFWSALWAGRSFHDTVPTIDLGIGRVIDATNDAGCCAYNDPYGFIDACGQVETATAKALVQEMLPLIIRGQRADGGWGESSLFVFRALKAYNLLDRLREAPPLPPDWRVAQSFPAPGGKIRSLTWDGRHLWVYDAKANAAIALSPEDGAVARSVELPVENVVGIGWWDGSFAVTQSDPKMLLRVSPDSGEVEQEILIDETDWVWVGLANRVNGKLWVADEFSPCIIAIDTDHPDRRQHLHLGGPGVGAFTPADGGVWHADFWAHLIVKSAPDGTLLDWGDKPFDVRGLAFDGERLWALDGDKGRVCVLARTGPPRGGLAASGETSSAPEAKADH